MEELSRDRTLKTLFRKSPLLKSMLRGAGSSRAAIGKSKPRGDVEKEVLGHKNETVVTPRVGEIAEDLFQQTLHMAGVPLDSAASPIKQKLTTRPHFSNPVQLQWVMSSETAPGFYGSVIIDGVQYSVSGMSLIIIKLRLILLDWRYCCCGAGGG